MNEKSSHGTIADRMIVTVDVGGTKTLITSFDADGQKGDIERFATPKDEVEFATHLKGVIDRRYPDREAIDAIAVALPGVFNDEGTLHYAINLGWRQIDIKKQLSHHYDCPIVVENDANLAGLAEARAREPLPETCLYLTVSTGIGSGIIVDGKIATGLNNSEAGHMQLEYNDEITPWESFASGKSIYRDYDQFAREITDPEIWQDIADKLARGFYALIPVIQPDIIIVGGSIGTYFDRYGDFLKELIDDKFTSSPVAIPRLEQAIHPEEAVVYGCYYYAVDHLSR